MEKKAKVMVEIKFLNELVDDHIFKGHNEKERNFDCEICRADCMLWMQEFLHNPAIDENMDEESKKIVANFNLPS